jgi:hypothetical protein
MVQIGLKVSGLKVSDSRMTQAMLDYWFKLTLHEP